MDAAILRVIWIVRPVAEIVVLDEPARQAAAGRVDGRPVRRIERVRVFDPTVGPERPAGCFELHDVVEMPEAAVQLPLRVSHHVVREPEPRSEFVPEPEVDARERY